MPRAPAPDALRPCDTKRAAPWPPVRNGTGKSSNARQRLSMVSCTPHKVLQCGHSKCSPGRCSSRSSKRFGSPSKQHWATRHCRPSPSAAVKSSSGVIVATDSTISRNANCVLASNQVLLRRTVRSEERAQELSNAKYSCPQRGAKPAQGRNEINGRGPPLAGRMPFMSDSTLNRRSAALVTHTE